MLALSQFQLISLTLPLSCSLYLSHPNLRLQPPELLEGKLLLFEPLSLWDFVIPTVSRLRHPSILLR